MIVKLLADKAKAYGVSELDAMHIALCALARARRDPEGFVRDFEEILDRVQELHNEMTHEIQTRSLMEQWQ